MKILVITPHLDDAIIGAGGTLIKCLNEKDEVILLELFECIETLEITKDLEKMGFKVVKLGQMNLDYPSIIKLTDFITQANPNRIFVGIGAYHLDHLKAYELGIRAIQLARENIKFGSTLKTYIFENIETFLQGSKPNEFFVDISKELDSKIKILNKFKEINRFADDLNENMQSLSKLRGWQSRVNSAELFSEYPISSGCKIFDSFENKIIFDETPKVHKHLP